MSKSGTSTVKGRAWLARPLTCFFLVTALLAVTSASSSAAAGQPKKPTLTGTNPASPSTSLRPSIEGNSEGVITSVLSGRSRGGFVTRAGGGNPGFEITIYAEDPTCSEESAIVAEGS